jgi:hypothetical protein
VRLAIDHHPATPADAFAAVVVELDGFLPVGDEALVEKIEHLKERHLLGDPAELIGDELPRCVRAFLTPHLEGDVHL